MKEPKVPQLPPTTNKALFHSLSDVFNQLRNGEMPIDKANALCNVASKMQKSMEIEIERAKTSFVIGQAETKIREIEVINPET